MEEEIIAQTKFDQLISDDQSQMLKAFIPYLSPRGQQLLSVFTKTRELSNTLALFRGSLICRSAVLLFPVLPNFWMIFGNSAMAEAAGSLIRSATFLA